MAPSFRSSMASDHTYLLDFEAYRPPADADLQMSYARQVDTAHEVRDISWSSYWAATLTLSY